MAESHGHASKRVSLLPGLTFNREAFPQAPIEQRPHVSAFWQQQAVIEVCGALRGRAIGPFHNRDVLTTVAVMANDDLGYFHLLSLSFDVSEGEGLSSTLHPSADMCEFLEMLHRT